MFAAIRPIAIGVVNEKPLMVVNAFSVELWPRKLSSVSLPTAFPTLLAGHSFHNNHFHSQTRHSRCPAVTATLRAYLLTRLPSLGDRDGIWAVSN